MSTQNGHVNWLSEKTYVPITVVVIVFGAAMWLARIEGKSYEQDLRFTKNEKVIDAILKTHNEDMEKVSQEQWKRMERIFNSLNDINKRLSKIEGILSVKQLKK